MEIEKRIALMSSQDGKGDLEAMEDLIVKIQEAEKVLEDHKMVLADSKAGLDVAAAHLILKVEGGNAEQRKANLTIAKSTDSEYLLHDSAVRQAEQEIVEMGDTLSMNKRHYAVMRLRIQYKTAQLEFLAGGN